MVEYVKIKGKKYPVKVGYYVMKKVKELVGTESLSKALKENKENLELYETMLYAALKQGAYEEGEELDLKKDEMGLALGSCFLEFIEIIGSAKFYPSKKEDDKTPLNPEELGKEEEEKPTRTK